MNISQVCGHGNGGAWSADSRTLPAALDIEHNSYGAMYYGLSQASMRTWISDFLATRTAGGGRAHRSSTGCGA